MDAFRSLRGNGERVAFTVEEAARFDNAPCFVCDYNGENYYQPATHSCAKRYHAHHALAAAESAKEKP